MTDRQALIDAAVTLDGRPAKINGAARPFAIVRTMDGATSGEWAWETVVRIVANGGAFRT